MRECRFKRSLRVNEAPQRQVKGFSLVSAFVLISFALSLSIPTKYLPPCRRTSPHQKPESHSVKCHGLHTCSIVPLKMLETPESPPAV